jgi:TP901 family phage tail tape measure protein
VEKVGVELVAENERGFTDAMKRAEGAVSGFGDSAERQGPRVNGLQAALTGAFTAIASAAIDAMARASEAVVGFVTDSVDAASKFNTGLAMLKATAGATPAELEKVADLAMQLGNDLSLPASSAMDANEAILELVKGGLSLDDAMAAARGTLLLSTAAQVDAAEAAKITAGAINAFGLEGKDAQKIVDLLAGAAAKGAGEITDYSQGFQQAGFAFNSAGMDASELATSLQTLIERGLTGSDAGTALKNAIVRLQNPTKEAAGVMESLGINVYDAQGNMKPMSEIIGIFNKQMSGMTQEQKNAVLGTVFLSDGMKAMIPLLDEGSAKFDERRTAVSEAGSAQALAAAQTEGFAGAQAALTNSLETLQLVIGTALLPILTQLLQGAIIPAVSAVLTFAQAFLGAEDKVGFLADAVSQFIPGIENLFPVLQTLGQMFQAGFAAAQSVVSAAGQVIMAVFAEVGKFIDAHSEEISAIFQMAWATIQMVIRTAIMFIERVIAPALRDIAQWISDHSAEIQAIFTFVWNVIRTVIQTVLTIIQGILRAAMQLMQGDTEGALETLRATFENVWGTIRNVIQDIVTALGNWLKQKFDEIKNTIVGAIQNAIAGVRALFNSFLELGKGIIDSIVQGITGAAQGIIDALRNVIMGAINAAISIFPGPIQDALRAFFGISGGGGGRASYQQAPPGDGGGGGGQSFSKSFNLTLNSSQASSGVMSDFAIMEALA